MALAEEVAEVEEVAKSAVVPLGYYPYAYNQLHWPGVYGVGYSSQCWGCRGKRSADPAPGVSPPFPGNIKMEDIDDMEINREHIKSVEESIAMAVDNVRTHHIVSRILNFLFAIVCFFKKKNCIFDKK